MSTDNCFDLTGRKAVVTGGSRGLGYTMARALARAGAEVLIAARSEDQLEKAIRTLRDEHELELQSLRVDLGDTQSTENFGRAALKALGRVDIFVGNAGVEHPTKVDATSAYDVTSIFTPNTTANILLTSIFSPGMKAQGWGRIIFVTSVVARVASCDGHGVYSASKSAVEGFARVAAVELGASGVTVNCISPGVYLTDLPRERFKTMAPDLAKQTYDIYADMTATRRWGDPAELEGPLLMLASDAGSYVTGTVLHVDGGLSIRMHGA